MCGRFSLVAAPQEVRAVFDYTQQPNFPPRYNIAPTQPVGVVRSQYGERRFDLMRWGLIPPWVKDPGSFTLLINARTETVEHKPSFRGAIRHNRCLFPVSGYYEWRRSEKNKQAYYIKQRSGALFALAGLWETWSDPDGGDMDTAAILTTQANSAIAPVHHRMPVVIMPENFEAWLETGRYTVREVRSFMVPAPENYLEAIPVSSRVNSVANDDPQLTEPVEVHPDTNHIKTADKKDNEQLDLF